MEYISAEKFLKQPKEVQDVFLMWWKNNVKQYDLFYRKHQNNYIERQKYIVTEIDKYDITTIELRYEKHTWNSPSADIDAWDIESINNIIPLFTEGQLRKFIEDKMKDKIIAVYSCDGYNISKAFDYDNEYKTKQDDLLYAYWQVACLIAKDNIKEEKYINKED